MKNKITTHRLFSWGKYLSIFLLWLIATLSITNGYTIIQSTIGNAVQYIKQTVFTDSGIDSGTRLMDVNAASGYIYIDTWSLTNSTGRNNKFLAIDENGYMIYANETDPLFSASAASTISQYNVTSWNSGWLRMTNNIDNYVTLDMTGNRNSARSRIQTNSWTTQKNYYLTSMSFNSGNNLLTLGVSGYGPVTGYIIFSGINNWNSAYSWIQNNSWSALYFINNSGNYVTMNMTGNRNTAYSRIQANSWVALANYYLTWASFNSWNNILSLYVSGYGTVTWAINLSWVANRSNAYSWIQNNSWNALYFINNSGDYVTMNTTGSWNTAYSRIVNNSGNALYFINNSGDYVLMNMTGNWNNAYSRIQANSWAALANYYLTGASFNSWNNILSLYVSGYGTVTWAINLSWVANRSNAYSRTQNSGTTLRGRYINTGLNINSLAVATLPCATGQVVGRTWTWWDCYNLLSWEQWPIWPQWIQGITWVQWIQWETWEQGIQGITGAQGIQGITWEQGIQGITWEQWIQGITGEQGIQWIQWITWAKWETGDIWLTWPKGNTGEQGINWIDGITWANWPTGAMWPTWFLQPWITGATPFWDGSDWITNSINIFNTWFNIGIGNIIPKAKLDINGNLRIREVPYSWSLTWILVIDASWFVYRNDSSLLVGPQGIQWATWAQWIQWVTGAKWETGDIWPIWPKGNTGEQWITGEQGIQWVTWAKWETGDIWLTWPKGNTGEQGIQWIQWITWATGPTGAMWPTGNSQDKYLTGMFFNSGNNLLSLYVSWADTVTWYLNFLSLWTGDGILLRPTQIGEVKFQVGENAIASGSNTIAIWPNSAAYGGYSAVIGYQAITNGNNSYAFGNDIEANGDNSFVIGILSKADGKNGFGIGNNVRSQGTGAFAIGNSTDALWAYSMAIWNNTISISEYSTVMGIYNIWITGAIFELWIGTSGTNKVNALTIMNTWIIILPTYTGFNCLWTDTNGSLVLGACIWWDSLWTGNGVLLTPKQTGEVRFQVGFLAQANGTDTIALGASAQANEEMWIAIGNGAISNSHSAIAIWTNSTSFWWSSLSIGNESNANGNNSFAIGWYVGAEGTWSFALWNGANALWAYSMAIWNNIIAISDYSTVIGTYNIWITWTIFELGMGTSGEHKNALTITNTWIFILPTYTGLDCLWTDASGTVIAGTCIWWSSKWTYNGGDIYNNNYATGKVGIWLTAPQATLHVQWDLMVGYNQIMQTGNTIAWWTGNTITGNNYTGGYWSWLSMSLIGQGIWNTISDRSAGSFIGAGLTNTITSSSLSAFIWWGYTNNIYTAPFSFIGWWFTNAISGSTFGFIWWGKNNKIFGESDSSSIVGWLGNQVINSWLYSFIGWGSGNTIDGNWWLGIGVEVLNSAIVGGKDNNITLSLYSFIGGGKNNSIMDSDNGSIPGGLDNRLSGANYSRAGGRNAEAIHEYSFVWNSTTSTFTTTKTNTFIINATNGVGIQTNDPQKTLDVSGSIQSNEGIYLTGGFAPFRLVYSGTAVEAQFYTGGVWVTSVTYELP